MKEKLRKPKRPSDEYIIMQNEAKTMKALNVNYYIFSGNSKTSSERKKNSNNG